MPKKRRKSPVTKRTGKFLPDRIVGFLTALAPVVALIFLAAVGGLAGFLLSLGSEGKGSHGIAATVGRIALILLGLVLCGFLLWVSIRTAQGRKIGLIFTALFGGLGLAGALYPVSQGKPVDYSAAWQLFLLLYGLIRLGGWGPKPT